MKSHTSAVVACAIWSIAAILPNVAVGASGFLIEPAGQATGSTCQSYAVAVALATKNDPSFRITTAADLRKAEIGIRAEIKRKAGNADVTHDHIRGGFETYTKGKYALKFRDVSEAEIGTMVGQVTGVTSAAVAPPTFLLGAIVENVVLASATKIGTDQYTAGHIFTIYGVDGPPNSGRRYLVLNSGVKVKDRRYTCAVGLPDDPGDYSASLSWKSSGDITFKRVTADKVRLWTIDKVN